MVVHRKELGFDPQVKRAIFDFTGRENGLFTAALVEDRGKAEMDLSCKLVIESREWEEKFWWGWTEEKMGLMGLSNQDEVSSTG